MFVINRQTGCARGLICDVSKRECYASRLYYFVRGATIASIRDIERKKHISQLPVLFNNKSICDDERLVVSIVGVFGMRPRVVDLRLYARCYFLWVAVVTPWVILDARLARALRLESMWRAIVECRYCIIYPACVVAPIERNSLGVSMCGVWRSKPCIRRSIVESCAMAPRGSNPSCRYIFWSSYIRWWYTDEVFDAWAHNLLAW